MGDRQVAELARSGDRILVKGSRSAGLESVPVLLAERLGAYGYRVTTASGVAEMERVLSRGGVDLVILDELGYLPFTQDVAEGIDIDQMRAES